MVTNIRNEFDVCRTAKSCNYRNHSLLTISCQILFVACDGKLNLFLKIYIYIYIY
jgi:hypothetical protein